jgi:hypothetical protein
VLISTVNFQFDVFAKVRCTLNVPSVGGILIFFPAPSNTGFLLLSEREGVAELFPFKVGKATHTFEKAR